MSYRWHKACYEACNLLRHLAMIRDTSQSDTKIAAPKSHRRSKLWAGFAVAVAMILALGAWVMRGGTPSYDMDRVRIGKSRVALWFATRR